MTYTRVRCTERIRASSLDSTRVACLPSCRAAMARSPLEPPRTGARPLPPIELGFAPVAVAAAAARTWIASFSASRFSFSSFVCCSRLSLSSLAFFSLAIFAILQNDAAKKIKRCARPSFGQ